MTRSVAAPQSFVVAGIARADVTPPVGIYHRMWGAARHDLSTGVHRPLYATVLTLSDAAGDAETKIAIGLDHCLLWTAEMQTLLQRVSERSGADPSSLIVFFSHTHGAGLMGLERQQLPGGDRIPPYLDELATTIARLIGEAMGSASAASITYGVGRCALATNRDYWDAERGQSVCGFNPDRTADDSVIVGRISDDSGATIATLVNYACHPTTLAWDNTLISPDYIGAMREVVETATGAPCLFIQGASGDVGPREGFVGDAAVADRNGRQLGYAVLSALEDLLPPQMEFTYSGPVISGATIGTWRYQPLGSERTQRAATWRTSRCTVDLPLRKDLPQREELLADQQKWQREQELAADDAQRAGDARAMAERATRRLLRLGHLNGEPTYSYHVPLWRMGNAIWLSLNGEHYNVLQTELRKRFPEHVLVIGTLANGSDVWYLPDAASFGKGLYQEEASILARGSLEIVIDALTHAVRQLCAEAP